MKKDEHQKFQDFKLRHNLTNEYIAKIMSEYASSEDKFSCSYFCDKYKLTPHVFYKMRDYTIIFMLVSPITRKNIHEKAVRNQIGQNPTGTYNSSYRYYNKLLITRNNYLKSFSFTDIIQATTMYANNISIKEIAQKHDVSLEIVRTLIALALINRLIDEKTYHLIKVRSDRIFLNMHGPHVYSAEKLWRLKNATI